MAHSIFSLREGVVFFSAVIYWVGVIVNAYRVRKHIGRSPNLKPSGLKERLLWTGWLFIITGWIAQPLIIEHLDSSLLFSRSSVFLHTLWFAAGIVLITGGYAGTLLCYAALGDSWRIGIDKKETTTLVDSGPYRYIRHPIYLFQILMLFGAAFLIPTLFSLMIICIHVICIVIKARDEETHLIAKHDSDYTEYFSRTGRFFPRLSSETKQE